MSLSEPPPNNPQAAAPGASASDAAATQHLFQLPKMSPTAGVGVQDYVAINVAAVVALLLGFASVFSLMNNLLLVIPLAAAITAASAIRQINHSNGTQTGGGIAMIGLFLSVLLGSFVGASGAADWAGRRSDLNAIDQIARQFGQDLHARSFDDAYDLFSQRFKSTTPRADFVGRLKLIQDSYAAEAKAGGLGPMKSAHSGTVTNFFTDADTGAIRAQSEIKFGFEGTDQENTLPATFIKSREGWTIGAIPSLFPSKAREQ